MFNYNRISNISDPGTIRLKDLLRLRLSECGWSDQVRLLCRDTVKDEAGRVNVDKILQKVTPEARRLVPDAVKMELLQKIKKIINKQLDISEE